MRLVGTVAVRRHWGGLPESPGIQPEAGSRSRNQKCPDLQGRNRILGSRMAVIDKQIRAPLGRSGMCVDAPASMTKWACRNFFVRSVRFPNSAAAGIVGLHRRDSPVRAARSRSRGATRIDLRHSCRARSHPDKADHPDILSPRHSESDRRLGVPTGSTRSTAGRSSREDLATQITP